MASAFMEACKLLKEKEVMGVEEWKIFFDGVQRGIVKRGKSSVGDKTIFDVFYPVYESTIDVVFENESAFFAKITEVAQTSLHKTKEMKAQFGKAACFGDKSIGHEDAGATVAYLLAETINSTRSQSYILQKYLFRIILDVSEVRIFLIVFQIFSDISVCSS
jgi:phosphoenolpyruvate---glycerone phosphotransferase subunit DhaL